MYKEDCSEQSFLLMDAVISNMRFGFFFANAFKSNMKISSHTTRSSADCGPRLLSFVHPTAPEPETATAGPRVSGGVAKSRNAADCGSRHLS